MRSAFLVIALMAIPALSSAQQTAVRNEVVVEHGPETGQRLYDNSWAVLIGVDEYENWENTRLSAPSASEMRRALVEVAGFPEDQITILTNGQATLQAVRDLLGGELPFSVGPDARLLIYWAGHTAAVDLPSGGRLSYLIPADGAKEAKRFFSTCLSLRELRTLVDLQAAKHILLLLDTPAEGLDVEEESPAPASADGWIARNASALGRQVLTSASPGEVVVEASGWEHTALVSAVVEGLVSGDADANRDGVISSSELATHASPRVFEATGQKQTPRIRNLGDGTGEFLFVSPKSTTALAPPPPPPPPAAMGHLQVNVAAPGSRVFVDGVYRGEASPGAPLNLQNVGMGAAEVRVEAPGYDPVIQSVSLAPNQWTQSVVGLKAPGSPGASGSRASSPSTPSPPGLPAPVVPPAPGTPSTSTLPEIARQEEPPPDSMIDMMVEIPAGESVMGSEDGGRDERPPHTVRLDRFWMDKREVTVAEFTRYDLEYKPSRYSGCDDCPATNVSWEDAVAYCSSLGKRLPTEAEWEKACRGPGGLDYPWGDKKEPSMARFGDEWNSGSVAVGTYSANEYGLHDMTGNVWEWVHDWYDEEYYSRAPEENPTGTRGGRTKVIRGGSWYGSSTLRCWDRNKGMRPAKRSRNLGFRCVW